MFPPELAQVAIFTIQQLREHGVAERDLRRALADRRVTRVKRGWYTCDGSSRPGDLHRLRVLAELRDHPDTVASHHSGAAFLRLPVHRPDWSRVHLMRTDGGLAQNRAGVVIHQQVGDATRCDPALVIAQTSLFCPVSGLMAMDHALRNELTDLVAFDHHADALSQHCGRGHLPVVRRLADGLRESPLESRGAFTLAVWGWRTIAQFPVPGTDYRADGRLVGTRVLVEYDGLGKYDEPGASVREKIREDEIRALDWEVVRVTSELLDEPALLARRVRDAIDRAQRFSQH